MDEPTSYQADEASTDEQAAMQRRAVEVLLAERLKDAVDAREQSGIEQIWQEDEDQYNGVDDLTGPVNVAPGTMNKVPRTPTDQRASARSRVYLNITKPKTDTAVSRVQEMLLPHDDKPWEVRPTPIPELTKAAAGEDKRTLTLADGTQAPAEKVAKAMVIKADKAADAMEQQIEDWFVEGKTYSQMRKVIRDAGRIGTGILKGPVPCYREEKKWTVANGTASLEAIKRLAPHSEAKSPWDLFPDPSAGDNPHAGAYIIERDYLTARRLRALAKLPEYDQEAMAAILKEGPRKRSRFDDREYREKDGQAPTLSSDTYEVFYYYGDLPPEQLLAGGWMVAGFNDGETPEALTAQVEQAMQLTTVSIVATMVNDRVVRVSLNPLETGEFPFDFFVWEPVDDQPWGRGVPRKMATAQKMLNASTRAMLENAGMSAGPQVIIDRDRIQPANGIYEITGRKLWYWSPGDDVKDVRFAFASVMIDSAQQQLQAIIDFALKMADELSNMPLLLQGIVGSQAPETLGGQAMAQANATSPLKAIAKQYDDGLIVPHLTRYYAWAMQDPNVSADAKGDMQCAARGSTTLIYRDMAAQFLPQLAPLLGNPAFKANPEKWFAEMLRTNKVNPASIQYTDDEAAAIQQRQEEQGAPADPKVEAAKIKAESDAANREATQAMSAQKLKQDAQEAALDRENDLVIKGMEREIQVLEFSGQREISLEEIRAMLASQAMKVRNEREMFVAERQFAEGPGEGRGL